MSKFCCDCKYFRFSDAYSPDPSCSNKAAKQRVDLVLGVVYYSTCYNMRYGGICGTDATLFEPKPQPNPPLKKP